MEKISIRRCAVSDIENAPNIAELLAEYADECGTDGMPAPKANWSIYHRIEDAGSLVVAGAFDGDKLVGFVFVMLAELPHYSALTATTESLFIASDYRVGMTGVRLINEAENIGRERGAVGLLVSSPYGSRLSDLLRAVGMRENNRVFFRSLA